jgi:GAF domain-containing protein
MLSIRQFFAAPTFVDDESRTRTASLLNVILWANLAVVLLSAFSLPLATTPGRGALVIGLMAWVVISVRFLLRSGRVRLSAWLYSLLTWAAVTLLVILSGGVSSPMIASYVEIVIIAGLLLGGRAAITFAAFSIVFAVGIYWADVGGLLPEVVLLGAPVAALAVLTGFLVVAAVLLYLATRSIDEALGQSRRYAAELEGQKEQLEVMVADRTRDLEQRAVQLATAAEVGRAAASILDLATLVPRVVDLVRERFDLYYAGLFLLDDAGEYAVLEAGTGESGRLMKEQGHKLQVGGVSMVGSACAQKQARIALDVGNEPVRFDNPLLPETRSEMALPLIVGTRVLGVLDVQSTEPAAFSEEDIAVLQLVANQVAVAVDNARKFSDEAALLETASPVYRISRRLATAATTDEIAQVILDAIAETEADGASVAWLNRALDGQVETVTFLGSWDRRGAARFPIGVPTLPSANLPLELASHFFVVEDAAGDADLPEATREYMSRAGLAALVNIPLHAGDRAIGFIRVDRSTPGPFPLTTLELYRALAEQASVALERARLLEETQRRVAQERLAASITRRIRSSTDVDTILRISLQELGHALGAADGLIHLGVSHGTAGGRGSVPTHHGDLSHDDATRLR